MQTMNCAIQLSIYITYQMILKTVYSIISMKYINVTNIPLYFLVHCAYCHIKNTLLHCSNSSADIKTLIINHITSRHVISLH